MYDDTANTAIDGTVDVVSESHWSLRSPDPPVR